MLKEKFEKGKQFIKDHKREIIIGGVVIAGTIVSYKLAKHLKDVIETNRLNNEAAGKIMDHYVSAYNKACDEANAPGGLIDIINEKYSQYDFSKKDTDPAIRKIYNQYMNEHDIEFDKLVNKYM